MRYIDPKAEVIARLGDRNCPPWESAVLCFRDYEGSAEMLDVFNAEPYSHELLYGMFEPVGIPRLYQAMAGNWLIGLVSRCEWGGPQAAILVEELAAIGVKRLIGIGAAGSIDHVLPRGCQVYAKHALTSDGTSKAYTTRQLVGPSSSLLELIWQDSTFSHLRPIRVAAVDAMYRETENYITGLRKRGAKAVNLEIGAFYAASKCCGLDSIWLGHISDRLIGKTWETWSDLKMMSRETAEIALALLTTWSYRAGH